jgi:hypothetical protein
MGKILQNQAEKLKKIYNMVKKAILEKMLGVGPFTRAPGHMVLG